MIQKQYILALDQGTTSSRSILFNHEGKICALAQKEYPQYFPKPGWVEQKPEEIWQSLHSTMQGVLAKFDASEIAAIGITNQRETSIVWEKDSGKAVYPAIVWQDRRTADYCKQLKEQGLEDMIREKTGKRLDPYFSATKLRWILENVPGARSRAEKGELLFGTVDSWLLWNLTGGKVHATDASNADRTLLSNVHTGDWDEELLELFDIPRSLLPEIRSSSEVYGETSSGIPITGMAGDQSAALFGQACFSPGMVKNTYGTGCFMLMNTGENIVKSKNKLLTTVAWRLNGKTHYALEGSVFVAGAAIQWLRDKLGIISSAAECDVLAAEVGDSGGLYFVPAFTGLGAPHWDPYARGLFIGLTLDTDKRHFCRAALDAIAYQSAELGKIMAADSGVDISELRVDGGAARSEILLQFQADLLQVSVLRPKELETTALGAAYLAGLAVGFWQSQEEISERWQLDQSYTPRKSGAEAAALQEEWQRAIQRAKNWQR